jgi:hypothetical protein
LAVVALVALAGCASTPASTSTPVASSTATSSEPAVDIRRLPTLDGSDVSSWPWAPTRAKVSGYLQISMTANGVCASLSSWGHPLAGFFWPAGYAVRSNPLRVIDGHGQFVAADGDYLYVAGRSVDAKALPYGTQLPCPAALHRVVVVDAHGRTGTPIGAAKRPLVVVDCQTPQTRPGRFTMACGDAGLILEHMRYANWGPNGASGTAVAVVKCFPGSDRVPVTFTFGHAQLRHGLLALAGPHLVYGQRSCLQPTEL